MSRAGSASRPEVSKSLEPEVSRGRTWFAAGCVLELSWSIRAYLDTILKTLFQELETDPNFDLL